MSKMTYNDQYSKKGVLYDRLIDRMIKRYGDITLPAEYSYFVQDNLLQFLIRLARFKFAAKMLRPSDEVLEIGCGSGVGTNFLAQHCHHIQGIDVKEGELNAARLITKRKNVSFQCIDFFNLSGKKRYNAIVLLDVIEHMPKVKAKQFIRKTTCHLKKNGLLIIGTPSIYASKYQGPLSRASHIRLYDQDELRQLIDGYYGRTVAFSMNDEIVHTGFSKLAWYYFVLAFNPQVRKT